jgi:hypothetical protein
MTAQELETNLTHMASVSLSNLEALCKELATEVKEDWPNLVHLVTSGDLGKNILSGIALLKPIINFAEMMLPQFKTLIDWIVNILTQIANLYPVTQSCSCPACAA